jgi:pimeloyl-ACP methyl ester carboxylesterase
MRFVTTAAVDWEDIESALDYLVAYSRVLAGDERTFDEQAARAFVRRDLERARNFASLQNHDLLARDGDEEPRGQLSSINVPTLVIHGSADPMFPLEHGQALAAEIPGARLLTLQGAGHGLDRADRATVAAAILEHTSSAGR